MCSTKIGVICAAVIAIVATSGVPVTAEAQAFTSSERDQLSAYHAMQGVTLGLMGATATLGAIQLYNLPTPLSEGACARDQAIFGSFACEHRLSIVHAALGASSVGSFIATAVLARDLPDRNRSGTEQTISDALLVATGVGLGLTAIIGLIAANFGGYDLQRSLRIVHMGIALLTAGFFATQVVMEHVD